MANHFYTAPLSVATRQISLSKSMCDAHLQSKQLQPTILIVNKMVAIRLHNERKYHTLKSIYACIPMAQPFYDTAKVMRSTRDNIPTQSTTLSPNLTAQAFTSMIQAKTLNMATARTKQN